MGIIIHRELREMARQYGLRLLGGGIMTFLLWVAWESATAGPVTSGRGIFLGLHRLLFLGIWLIGPVLTADCLSREKREGTLGLLFLTPLRPVDVVIGKAFSQSARACLFLMAAMPVMVVPVLLGGVTWLDALRLFLLQFAALGLALSAGLAASSLTTRLWRARILALAFATGAGAVFVAMHLSAQVLPARNAAMSLAGQFHIAALGLLSRSGLGAGAGFNRFWQEGVGVQTSWASVGFAAAVWAASWLLAALVVWLAAEGLRRTWRTDPGSNGAGVETGRGNRSRKWSPFPEGNPIRWLYSRDRDARVAAWLLIGAALIGWRLTTDPRVFLAPSHIQFLRPALLGLLALAATASFRAARESGALELWLVSPLTPEMILRGRLFPLLGTFSGAYVVLVVLPWFPLAAQWASQWLDGTDLLPVRPSWLWQRAASDLHFALWMVTTALLGIALSLSRLSFPVAFVLTWVMHHVPSVAVATVQWLPQMTTLRKSLAVTIWDPGLLPFRIGTLIAGVVLIASWRFGLRQLTQRRFLRGLGSPRLPRGTNPGEVRPR